MNVLVVSATEFEIEPLVHENNIADVLITGIGIPATIFHLTKKLSQKNYDLVIQAGIAGTFSPDLKKGTVLLVDKDAFGDLGIYEKGNFKTLFDSGFINENEFPFSNGWLVNRHEYLTHSSLSLATGITVNKITDDGIQIKKLSDKFKPDIESMEGAALHYVCLQQKIKFLQLRSISNTVGERDKQKWEMKKAITNLNMELKKIIQHFI
ncbi:MAG TPA: futalosine hydrolase [Ginsengibacter sp.]|jgi:futalosine hydrolase